MHENSHSESTALLLAVQTPDMTDFDLADSMREMRDLAYSIGCPVLGELVQYRPRIHPGTFMGAGKLKEAKELIKASEVDLAIFDADLSPSQGENLEKELGVMVIDRTQLILEIFQRNARTHEARIQVELAQLEYMLPRLVGMWAHLDRERGGIGGSKGAGEKQIDIDRSLIRHRIARLKKELSHVARERDTQKRGREDCFRVTLVGYTNAGKSTLMNRLTAAEVLVKDQLFATLDSTTRVMSRANKPPILLSDTVGFIKRLPHALVASFRSTLEVARDADLLVQVVDLSDERFEHQMETTDLVLREIGAHTVPRLIVFNKVDLLEDRLIVGLTRKKYPEALFVSASKDDAGEILRPVLQFFEEGMVTTPIMVDYAHSGELSKIYRWSRVDEVTYEQDGIHLVITSTRANLNRIKAHVAISA